MIRVKFIIHLFYMKTFRTRMLEVWLFSKVSLGQRWCDVNEPSAWLFNEFILTQYFGSLVIPNEYRFRLKSNFHLTHYMVQNKEWFFLFLNLMCLLRKIWKFQKSTRDIFGSSMLASIDTFSWKMCPEKMYCLPQKPWSWMKVM